MEQIKFEQVTKEFKIRTRREKQNIASLFHPTYSVKKAVNDVSFTINKGELVGYIGPNGAGKSTTIKMLSGILVPTKGNVSVMGRKPYVERKKNGMEIGVVFGQRSQLFWDLPVLDTFELYKEMYHIPEKTYRKNLEEYSTILGVEDFMMQPVRQLSLGQKMRAELCAAVLHDPQILYLDEPTIGLDVLAKSKVRDFIRTINERKNTTVILTTHDMADIEVICNRIILIDQGKVRFDGKIPNFLEAYGSVSTLEVTLSNEKDEIQSELFYLIAQNGARRTYNFDSKQISRADAVKYITQYYDIEDIEVKSADIESVLKRIYAKEQ